MKVLFRKRPKTTKKTYNFYIHQLNTKKAMSPTSDWVLFLFKWQDYSEQMCTEQSCTEQMCSYSPQHIGLSCFKT